MNSKKYPFPSKLACLVLAIGACAMAGARAEKADRDKPMNVVADSLKYDDLKQISQFLGKVVVTKGSLVIHADRVDVRQDPQGYQYGTAIALNGAKATFRQKRDKPDEWIEGEAEVLIYNGKADTVEFSKAAVIRRLKGTFVTDESAGYTIVYDNTTDTFSIDSGPKGAASVPGNPAGRVRAMLTPSSAVQDENSSKPAGPTVTLRSSAVLGDEKK